LFTHSHTNLHPLPLPCSLFVLFVLFVLFLVCLPFLGLLPLFLSCSFLLSTHHLSLLVDKFIFYYWKAFLHTQHELVQSLHFDNLIFFCWKPLLHRPVELAQSSHLGNIISSSGIQSAR
jgi:hypothetical protein